MEDILIDEENPIWESRDITEFIQQLDPENQEVFSGPYKDYVESVLNQLEKAGVEKTHFLEALISLPNPRARKVILMRLGFLSGKQMTQAEVAEELGLMEARVRQIEGKFIRYLRPHLKKEKLPESWQGAFGEA